MTSKTSSTKLANERTDLAEDRTEWAEDRTIMANERTFAGWMRTGLAAVGIGLPLPSIAREPTKRTVSARAKSSLLASGMKAKG